MMRLPVQEADLLRDGEIRTGITIAAAFAVVTLLFMLGAIGVSMALVPDLTGIVVAVVFALGGATVALVLILAFRRSRWHMQTVVNAWRDWIQAEIDAKYPPPQAAQTPAQEAQTVPVTSGVKEPSEIGGFDKADLLALCRAFAAGMKWTEDKMVGFTLPHTQETLTKARYIALMALFVERGVIDGRGGPGNKTGKLLIADPNEAYARLVNEAPALSGEPSKKNGAA